MLAGPMVLWAVLHLAEGPVTVYELGALSEAREQVQEQAGAWRWLSELEIDPRAALTLDSQTFGFTVAYAPRLWVTTATGGVQVLHRAGLQATLKPDPLYRFFAAVNGATGISDLLAPRLASPAGTTPGTTPGPIQVVGVQTRVLYVFGDAAGGFEITPTPRTRLALNGAFMVDGGGDQAARRSLPLQRGPRAAVAFDWRMTADDQLEGEVRGARRVFSTDAVDPFTGMPVVMPPVWVATFTEIWRRTYDKEFSTWVGAGASLSGVEATVATATAPATAAGQESAPVVDAGLQYIAEGGQQRLRLSGHYGPVIDAVTGRLFQRVDTSLVATWAPSRIWRLVGDLTAGMSIGGAAGGQTVVSVDVRVAYALSRELEATSGVRTFWQEPPRGSPAAAYHQYGLFLGLAYLYRAAF